MNDMTDCTLEIGLAFLLLGFVVLLVVLILAFTRSH